MTAETTVPETSAGISLRRRALIELLLDNLVWFILVIVIAGFAATIPNFLQWGILFNILEQSTFVGTIAVGLSLTLIAGHMDLSIESVLALTAMVIALVFGTHGAGAGLVLNPEWLALPVSLLIALAIGAVIGASNAFLVVRLGINAFIVTLASYIWVRGLVVALSGGRSVYGLPDSMRLVAVAHVSDVPLIGRVPLLGDVPFLGVMLILVFVVFAFVLNKTPFGRHLTLIGGNATAAYRAGIPVDRLVTVTFILSGAIAGFAGWLLAARTAGATANLGVGMLFEAFAAVVIGGVSLKGGYGRLSGVFAGVLLLSSISTAINVWGMPPHYTQIIRGALVLVAVVLDTLKTSIRRRYL